MKKKIQRTSSPASSGKEKTSFGNESYNRSTRINKKWVDEEIESGLQLTFTFFLVYMKLLIIIATLNILRHLIA